MRSPTILLSWLAIAFVPTPAQPAEVPDEQERIGGLPVDPVFVV